MSNNLEKHDENFSDNKTSDNQTPKIPEEPSNEQKQSPDENPPGTDTMIGSDDNVNESQTNNNNKETASVKSGEVAQQTPNNLSETTSPKASCSYQDFGNKVENEGFCKEKKGNFQYLTDSSSSRSPRSSDRHLYATNNRKSIVCRLRLEIENLQAEVVRLRGLVVTNASATYNETVTDDKEDPQVKIANLQKELQLAKEAVTSK